MMRYVTYDETGALTGSYIQDLLPAHADCYIEVDEATHENWLLYQANGARDGVVVAPVLIAEPAPAPSIPMLNLQLILAEDGKLDDAQAMIAAMPGVEGAKARAYWNKAENARRDNFVVEQLWSQLYDTEDEFNDAWARAAALQP